MNIQTTHFRRIQNRLRQDEAVSGDHCDIQSERGKCRLFSFPL